MKAVVRASSEWGSCPSTMRLRLATNAALLLLAGVQPSSAWVRLNGIFTDHMVLQTPHPGLPPARIFGLAYTSEQVVVESSVGIPGGAVTVSPKKTGVSHWPRPLGAPWGNWSVNLDFGSVMPGKPFSITIRSKQNASDSTTLSDVVVGEVFFCAGQSNMKLTVDATDDKDAEYAAAVELGSRARVNFIGGNLSLDGPQDSPNTGNWTLGSTTPDDNGTAIAQFSAVCWAHGRMIAEWLLKKHGDAAPVVGMVEVSVGGTTIHHWVPDYVGNKCNETGLLPNSGECVQYPAGWIYDGSVRSPFSRLYIDAT